MQGNAEELKEQIQADQPLAEVVTIEAVNPHPNADRLEIATIAGWECVIGKGQFKAGDHAIYVAVDSILPADIIQTVFKNSKILPDRGRIKTIRIRGYVSQGLLISASALPSNYSRAMPAVGTDVTRDLGITKYEPPQEGSPQHGLPRAKKVRYENKNFRVYTKIVNAKRLNKLFTDGEGVAITEKIHGSNFRCGWVARHDPWWLRALKLLRIVKADFTLYEFVYGSHYVQLAGKPGGYKGFYANRKEVKKDVYAEAIENYDLKRKLRPGEVLYGEVYGYGVQKNFSYGCADGERRLVAFDLERNGKFVDHTALVAFCEVRDIPMVPVLYYGPFSQEVLKACTEGPSVLAPEQKIREGAVIRPAFETQTILGRKILKSINPEYDMLGDKTEFH